MTLKIEELSCFLCKNAVFATKNVCCKETRPEKIKIPGV
jgi:hypothetical protein